jgi:parvulin-like peptidyl-prolyl isomerase
LKLFNARNKNRMRGEIVKTNWKNAALLGLPLMGIVAAGCNNTPGTAGGNTAGGATTGANLDAGSTLARVGDTPVTRGEMFTLLEANVGEQALRQLIDYQLVLQEAKAKGIEITDEQVNSYMDTLAATDPAAAEAMKSGGARLDALKQQTRFQIAREQLLVRNIKVDPKKLDAWFKNRRAQYDRPAQIKFGMLQTSQKNRADVLSGQLKSNSKTFLELVTEQKATKDQEGKRSFADSSEIGIPGGYLPEKGLPFPPAITAAIAKLKPNETTGVLTLRAAAAGQPGVFGIMKLLDRKAAVTAKATDPNVQTDYKLEQVARELVKENPGNPPFDKTIQQVTQALQQQGMQAGRFEPPTYRQVLDYITNTRVSTLLTELRTKGGVAIEDKQYVRLAEAYKPVPTPAAPSGAAGGAPSGGAPAGGAPAGGSPAGGAPAGGSPAGGASSSAPAGGASTGGAAAPAGGAANAASGATNAAPAR